MVPVRVIGPLEPGSAHLGSYTHRLSSRSPPLRENRAAQVERPARMAILSGSESSLNPSARERGHLRGDAQTVFPAECQRR